MGFDRLISFPKINFLSPILAIHSIQQSAYNLNSQEIWAKLWHFILNPKILFNFTKSLNDSIHLSYYMEKYENTP